MRNVTAKQTTAPATTPISVAELKSHLRIDGLTDVYEDALLLLYIKAAVAVCETYCRIAIMEQVWTAKLDNFADKILLPRPPLISVDEVTYLDGDGVAQTLASSVYQVDTFSQPGGLLLAYNQSWPTTRDQAQAITIEFTVGYEAADDVPENLKHGLKMLAGMWYGMRETADPGKPDELPLPWPVKLLFDQFQMAQVW